MSTSPTKGNSEIAAPGSGSVDNPQPARASVPSSKKFACVLCRRRKLKCDGAKPACATCSRLKHHCSYQDDGPKKPTAKRRNIRDLEARLAQVEGRLTAEQAKRKAELAAASASKPPAPSVSDWNPDDAANMEWNAEVDEEGGGGFYRNNSFPSDPSLNEDAFASSMIPLGMEEPMPPQDMQNDMYQYYFDKINPMVPMIHPMRFMAALEGPTHMQPALCLRYSIFAVAATVLERYSKFKEVFYHRARKYAEVDEMKGHGESFISVEHAQTWLLLGNYEVRNMAFPRAWISNGKATRLVQMMGLDRMDKPSGNLHKTIGPARDWIEAETRRRTFWSAFCSDRWSSAGTGWAMMVIEEDIKTNLPSSEPAFYAGQPEDPLTLPQLFTADGATRITSFTGVIFMATMFGRNINHMHRSGGIDTPGDYQNGAFWKRHRQLDNILAGALFSLPPHIKVPGGLKDPNGVFINMNIHSSMICLHQAAIVIAQQHNLGEEIIERSRTRSAVAADEIVNIMRMCSHLDISDMNPWICFSLYVAAQVFLEGSKRKDENFSDHKYNLEFVLGALQIIRHRHGIVDGFVIQLKLDMRAIGLEHVLAQPTEAERQAYACTRRFVMNVTPEATEDDFLNMQERFIDLPYMAHSFGKGGSYRPSVVGKPAAYMQISSVSSESPTNADTPSDKSDSYISGTTSGQQSAPFNLPTRTTPRTSPAAQAREVSNPQYALGGSVQQATNIPPLFMRSPKTQSPQSQQLFPGQAGLPNQTGVEQTHQPYQADATARAPEPILDHGNQIPDFQGYDTADQYLDPGDFEHFNFPQDNESLAAMINEAVHHMGMNNNNMNG